MAVTPEFLAHQIYNIKNVSAAFDEYISPKEGESIEDFQQRKQTIIDQTMLLIEAEKQAIEAYTRRLAIQAQLELEEKEGVDIKHANIQEINNGCLFIMGQIKSKYPGIEEKVDRQTVEEMRLDFVHQLQKIPLTVLQQYENVRNEYSALVDKAHKGALTAEESNTIIERERELKATQKGLEQGCPEIRYRLWLGQAGSQTFQPKHPPLLFSAENNTSLTEIDIHFNTAPIIPINGVNSGRNIIGSFFSSRLKVAKQAFLKSTSAASAQVQSYTNPPVLGPFFFTPIPLESAALQDYDRSFRICLLGDRHVGASCLRHRFVKEIYPPSYLGYSGEPYVFEKRTVILNEQYVNLRIWTAELYSKTEVIDINESPLRYHTWPAEKNERYRQVQDQVRRSDATIVIFDVTDRANFKNLPLWLKEIERYSNYTLRTLAATKCDMSEKDWQVSKEEIRVFAEENKLDVFFTSAKDNLNIEQLFEDVVNGIFQEEWNREKKESAQTIKPISGNFKRK